MCNAKNAATWKNYSHIKLSARVDFDFTDIRDPIKVHTERRR